MFKRLQTIYPIFIILILLCSCSNNNISVSVLNSLEELMKSHYDLQKSFEERLDGNKTKLNTLKSKLNSIEVALEEAIEAKNEPSEEEKQEAEYQEYVKRMEESEKADREEKQPNKSNNNSETTEARGGAVITPQTPLLNLLETDKEYTKDELMEIFRLDTEKSFLFFINSITKEEKSTDTFSIRISNVMDSDKYVLVKKFQAGDFTAPWAFTFESVAEAKEEEQTLPGQGPGSQNRKVLGKGNIIENETDETSPLLERADISAMEETTRSVEFEVKSFEFLE